MKQSPTKLLSLLWESLRPIPRSSEILELSSVKILNGQVDAVPCSFEISFPAYSDRTPVTQTLLRTLKADRLQSGQRSRRPELLHSACWTSLSPSQP
jgi:hypothetical protein